MALGVTIREKIAEGVGLKDVKHIAKRQKEGKLQDCYLRFCEEILIRKWLADGKIPADIMALTKEPKSGFDLNWTEKRIERQAKELKKTPKAKKEKKVKAVKEAKVAPAVEPSLAPAVVPATVPAVAETPAAPATEAPVVKRGKKSKTV